MADNHHRIVGILIKYAGNRRLKKAEARFLKTWMEQSHEHRELPDKLCSRLRQEHRQRQLDEAPSSAEVWENISRSLEESGMFSRIKRPEPATRYFLAKAAVVILVMAGGDWLYGLQDSRKIAQTPSKGGGNPVSMSTKTKGRVHANSTIWSNPDGRVVLSNVVPSVAAFEPAAPVRERISQAGTREPGEEETFMSADDPGLVTKLGNVLEPAPVKPDTVGRLRTSLAVATNSSSYFLQTSGQDTVDSYAISMKAYLRIVKDPARPVDIHFPDGRQIRVKGMYKPVGESPVIEASVASSPGYRFDQEEFEPALALVAGWYGLKVSNPGGWKGTAITAELPRPSRPESVVEMLQMLENGVVQLRLEQNVIVVSGWSGTR